ncbi:ATP-dependent DNA helicase [Spirosoma fluminis]
MTSTDTATIFNHLLFTATREQANALYELEEFVAADCSDDIFVLQGAAGTGKTSLVKALVDHLEASAIRYFLAAPTGRAAKVISLKTNALAHTIHHILYTPETLADDRVMLTRRPTADEPYSIYVVDEASMISDQRDASGQFLAANSLLFDLLDHIKKGNQRSKVIFIGDRYQLEPVNESFSPALQADYLRRKYKMDVRTAELTEVKRQAGNSPILALATDLRQRSDEGLPLNRLNVPRLQWFSDALRRYEQLYDPICPDNVVVIAYSNRDVNYINNAVRKRFGLASQPLTVGDLVVVHENWTDGHQLLVKGETGRVVALHPSTESKAGLTFVQAELAFTDSEGQSFIIQTQVLLDTLSSEKGQIDGDILRMLKAERMAKNPTYRQSERAHNDPYVGAMRLRYGYALTCHKAQGGEWNHVLLHPWFRQNDYRYAYTAVTRARESVLSWEPGGANVVMWL